MRRLSSLRVEQRIVIKIVWAGIESSKDCLVMLLPLLLPLLLLNPFWNILLGHA